MSNNDDTTEQYLLFFVIRGGKISGDFEKSDGDSQNCTQFLMCCKKVASMYTTVQKSVSVGFSYQLTASRCVSISSQDCPANPLKGEYYQKREGGKRCFLFSPLDSRILETTL